MSSKRTKSQITQQLPMVAAAWCLLGGRGLDHRFYASVPGSSLKIANPEADS
jgi:hypothetical protein